MVRLRKMQRSKQGIPILPIAVLLAVVVAGAAFFLLSSQSKQQAGGSTATTAITTVTATSIKTSTTLPATSTVTTPVGRYSQLSVPPPQPPTQIVREGANTTINDTGASGGISPYRYQWLAAVMNTSSNFTAVYGNTVCANATAQSATCNFQTTVGYNALLPGTYYLKLQASDSSLQVQVANSSTVYVSVR